MKPARIEPLGLSKYLVGDQFHFELELSSGHDYRIELHTNVNREIQNITLDHDGTTYHQDIHLEKSGFYTYQIRHRSQDHKKWQWLVGESGKKITGRLQVDPTWVADAVVYNVFVRFFGGKVQRGDELIRPGEGGTFDDVKKHLNDLQRMGINTLYFNPIHLIGELYRKYNTLDQLMDYLQPGSPYSIKDYKSIDPELTYDKDTNKHLLSDPQQEFRDLIDAAHERGMSVIMDLVFNHTAHDFVFQRIRPEWYFYKENINSLEDPFLYPDDINHGKPWGDPKHTLSPHDHGVWWEDAAQLNWEFMPPEGPNDPPTNPSLKEMWTYFKSIPRYWIRNFGVDGFRCDIAYRVPPKFWKQCIAEARAEAHSCHNNLSDDVIFIAEAMTNDLDLLQKAGFTAVYGDYSNKLARPVELNGYLNYMYNLSGDFFPQGSRWFIFPEAHDFDRAPHKVLGDAAGLDHDADLRANQSRWLLTATLPGIPLIFNGFEKIEWQPINLFSYGAVDWERDTDLRKFISRVNKIRHQHQSLQTGTYTFLSTNQGLDDHTQLFAYLRRTDSETIIVIVNMDVFHSAGPATIYLPEDFSRDYHLTDLLTHQEFDRHGQELLVELDPGQAHVFLVDFHS